MEDQWEGQQASGDCHRAEDDSREGDPAGGTRLFVRHVFFCAFDEPAFTKFSAALTRAESATSFIWAGGNGLSDLDTRAVASVKRSRIPDFRAFKVQLRWFDSYHSL